MVLRGPDVARWPYVAPSCSSYCELLEFDIKIGLRHKFYICALVQLGTILMMIMNECAGLNFTSILRAAFLLISSRKKHLNLNRRYTRAVCLTFKTKTLLVRFWWQCNMAQLSFVPKVWWNWLKNENESQRAFGGEKNGQLVLQKNRATLFLE